MGDCCEEPEDGVDVEPGPMLLEEPPKLEPPGPLPIPGPVPTGVLPAG